MKDFNPGFPPDILDVIELSQLEDLRRLSRIRSYLHMRVVASKNAVLTIFDDPQEGCFAQRYFNESDHCLELQNLHDTIEYQARERKENKEKEFEDKCEIYKDLVKSWHEASCVYTVNEYDEVEHDRKTCVKHYRERIKNRYSIDVLEYPMPLDPVKASVVIFELRCPRSFSIYRDTTWAILSTLASPTFAPGSENPMLLVNYSEFKPHGKPK